MTTQTTITLTEQYDIEKLLMIKTTPTIVNVLQEKYNLTSHSTMTDLFNNISIILDNIDKDGKVKITYERKNNARYYSTKIGEVSYNGGLVKMFRPIRHFLTSDNYVDVDMINGQPSVFLSLLEDEYKEETPFLKLLVEDRDEILKQLMTYYDSDRDTIKKLFIRIMNGGSYKLWLKENNFKKESSFLINFSEEMKRITKVMLENNPHIVDKTKKNSTNVANIYQHYETEIVMKLLNKLKRSGMADICSLQYDGIQIHKNPLIDTVVDSFNNEIKETFKYVSFKLKPLEMDIDDKDFKEGQKLLSEKLYYFDFKNLEKYLYGYKRKFKTTVIKGKMEMEKIEEEITISPYSMRFLKMWFLTNVKIIESNGKPKYVIRNKENDCKTMDEYVKWSGIDKKKKDGLTCNMYIKGTLMNVSTDNEFLEEGIIFNSKKIRVLNCSELSELYELFFKENDKQVIDMKRKMIFHPYFDDEKLDSDIFNLFTGFDFKDDNIEVNDFKDSIVYNHIKNITCSGDEVLFSYVQKWIAHLIQKPRDKHRVSLVQYGIQGTGKDTFCDFISYLIGNRYTFRTKDIDSYLKDFNSINGEKMVVVFNEVDDKSSKKSHDVLKHIIDSKTETIEPKFFERYEQNCYKRFIFNTNNKNAFNLELSNSRYLMLHTSPSKVGDYEYFGSINDMFKDKEYMKSAFHYFSTLDLTDFKPYTFPKTEYEKEQKLLNIKSPIKFIKELVENNELTEHLLKKESSINVNYDTYLIDETKESELLDCFEYTLKDLYSEYKLFCKESTYSPFNKNNFRTEIEDFFKIEQINTNPVSKYYPKRSRFYLINKTDVLERINTV